MERDPDRDRAVTPKRPGRTLAAIALLVGALLLAACGATAEAPQNDPTPTAPATFDDSTFDASTWR